jgi:hypothetical protein
MSSQLLKVPYYILELECFPWKDYKWLVRSSLDNKLLWKFLGYFVYFYLV